MSANNEVRLAALKRHRGMLLRFAYDNHNDQHSRLDDQAMWGVMMGMGVTLGQNEVITMLQDLCDRGYMRCKSKMNVITGRVQLREIELTHKGRDLVDGVTDDAAITVY